MEQLSIRRSIAAFGSIAVHWRVSEVEFLSSCFFMVWIIYHVPFIIDVVYVVF